MAEAFYGVLRAEADIEGHARTPSSLRETSSGGRSFATRSVSS